MSQVCKFYLRGNCNFGTRCHFLHEDPYNYDSYGYNQNKYSSQQQTYYKDNNSRNYGSNYNRDFTQNYERSYSQQTYPRGYSSQSYYANAGSNFTDDSYGSKHNYNYNRYHVDNRHNQKEPKNPQNYNPSEFLEIVIYELLQHEAGHGWPFTVIAPCKDFGNIPGFTDCSPEEIRYQYYESLSKNNLFEFENRIRETQAEIMDRRQMFKSKSSEAVDIVKKMLHQSGNTGTDMTPAITNFTFDVSKLHEGQPSASMESSSFNVPDTNFVSGTSSNQDSVQFPFNTLSTSAVNQNAFFAQSATVNDALSSHSQPQPQINAFTFNLNELNSGERNVQPSDDTLYSNIETLPPDTLELFQAKNFKAGKVPIVPPPRQLCFS